jgi:hypothetical protein
MIGIRIMEKLIRMRTEWRDALLAGTPVGSAVHKLVKSGIELKGFINMPKEVAMFCDDDGMGAILDSAKEHCPQAVAELQREIQRLRRPTT